MKLITTIIFIFLFSVSAFSQDISLPRETVEKALKAVELVPVLKEENENLKKQIEVLKASQQTPCSILQTTVKNNLIELHREYNNTKEIKDKKQLEKTIKWTRSSYKKSLASICNYNDDPLLLKILKIAIPIVPYIY